MKRIPGILILLVMMVLLCLSCAGAETPENVKLWPKQVSEDGLWGYVDADGYWVIPPQYEDADRFYGDYACVSVSKAEDTKNNWGIINRSGAFVLSPDYLIRSAESEGEGYGTPRNAYFRVTQDEGPWGFFDVRSGFFSGLKYEYVEDAYNEGPLVPVLQTRDGVQYLGYVDRATGGLKVPYQYHTIGGFSSFPEGVEILVPVIDADETLGEAQLVNQDGEVIVLPDGIVPAELANMSEGLIRVMEKGTELYGYADSNGNIVIPPAFIWARRFINGQARVALTEDHYALIDRAGNVILREEEETFSVMTLENAGTGKPRYAFQGENELYGYIDTQGRVVIPPQFSEADDFRNGYAEIEFRSGVSNDRCEGLIDESGQWVLYPSRNASVQYDNKSELFVISDGSGKCGFLDTLTGFFSGYAYDSIEADGKCSSLIPVVNDRKKGYADRKTGEIRIPCRYLIAQGFDNGYAIVSYTAEKTAQTRWFYDLYYEDNKLLLVDENGNEICPPERMNIDPKASVSDGLLLVKSRENGLYGYMNTEGQLAIPADYELAWSFQDGSASVRKSTHWFILDTEGSLHPEHQSLGRDMYYIQSQDQPDTLVVYGSDSTLLFSVHLPGIKGLYDRGAENVFFYEIKYEEDNTYRDGLISNLGEILTEPVFAHAGYFQDGLCPMEDPGSRMMGYIDPSGQWIIPPKYTSALLFDSGSAWVCENRPALFGEYGEMITERKLIDRTGSVLFTETRPDLEEEDARSSAKLWPKQAEDGLWGYADVTGNWVIPPKFDYAQNFRGSYAAVSISPEDEKDKISYEVRNSSGIIDQSGTFVLPPEYVIESGWYDGWGDFGTWDGGYYSVQKWNGEGRKSLMGFFDVRSGCFSGLKFEELWLTDSNGTLIPVVETRGGIQFLGYADRTTGEQVIPCRYWLNWQGPVSSFPEGIGVLAVMPDTVEDDTEYYPGPSDFQMMTKNGDIVPLPEGIIPLPWPEMSEGLIVIQDEKTELLGYADRNGSIVIPPVYEQAEQFENGKAEVYSEGKRMIINHEGKIIWFEP